MNKITSSPFFQKVRAFVQKRKKTSAAIGVAVILVAWYAIHKATTATAATSYVLGSVERGTIVSSISGTGQVEASNEVDLTARGSGQVTYVGVKAGQAVQKGQTLFALDSRDAQKAVRNAETDLETAQLDLDKFKEAPDSVDVAAIKASIADAQDSKTDADKTVANAYRSLLNTSTAAAPSISSSSATPPTISGTYQKDTETVITISVYQTADGAYFSASGTGGIGSSVGTVSTIVPQPLGDTGLYVKFASTDATQPAWVITLPNKTATAYASNLRSYQDALDAKQRAIDSADLSIAQDNEKLNDLYVPDPLDLRTKELAVQQRQDALTDAKQALSDYYVAAPFAGTIASVSAKVGDSAGGTLGTMITTDKIASISLNEVDVAKIKLGQKVTLTFDAIDDLTLTGEVAEIDTVGTVTQGVVNYTVKIGFDSQDERVKPGMTVTAAIITDTAQDVLMVPASAVKTANGASYVEVFATPPAGAAAAGLSGVASDVPPERVTVETGLSSDTEIAITSGLTEGQEIVTRTITASAAAKPAAASATSLLGGGARATGGAATRAAGGGFGR